MLFDNFLAAPFISTQESLQVEAGVSPSLYTRVTDVVRHLGVNTQGNKGTSMVKIIENSFKNEPQCVGVEKNTNSLVPYRKSNIIDPQRLLANRLVYYGVRPDSVMLDSVLAGPFHGSIQRYDGFGSSIDLGSKVPGGSIKFTSTSSYAYTPTIGYEGQDQITFLVISSGLKFRITVLFAVGPSMSTSWSQDDCDFIAPIPD